LEIFIHKNKPMAIMKPMVNRVSKPMSEPNSSFITTLSIFQLLLKNALAGDYEINDCSYGTACSEATANPRKVASYRPRVQVSNFSFHRGSQVTNRNKDLSPYRKTKYSYPESHRLDAATPVQDLKASPPIGQPTKSRLRYPE
jgi:hypothetical protein